MVRRAAAQRLGGFAKSVEKDYVSRELMPLFTDLMQDGEVQHLLTIDINLILIWYFLQTKTRFDY
jgi:hypothetical protein